MDDKYPFEYSHENRSYPELSVIDHGHRDNKKVPHLSLEEAKILSKTYKDHYYDKRNGRPYPVLICIHNDGHVTFEGSASSTDFSLSLPNGNVISERDVHEIHLIRKTKTKYFESLVFPTFTKLEDRFLVDYSNLDNLIYKVYSNVRWGEKGIKDVSIYYKGIKIDTFKGIIRLEVIEPGNYWFTAYDGDEEVTYKYLDGEIFRLHSHSEDGYYDDINSHVHQNFYPKEIELLDGDYVKINMFLNGYKPCVVCYQYCKENADVFKEIGSLIPEDDTINYAAYFQKNRLDALSFILYCQSKTGNKMQRGNLPRGFLGNGFFGRNASTLVPELADLDYPDLYKWKKTKKEIESSFDGLRSLYEVCDESFNAFEYPKAVRGAINEEDLMSALVNYLRKEGYRSNTRDEDKKYKEYYSRAVDEGVANYRWVKEYELFSVVEKMYDDAIYQYRAKWLDRQSLDIYIPSMNVGIEYQGQQHYEPVKFFGGESSHSYQQERDQIKLEKCRNNNTGIIYWRYDADIKKKTIKEAIENCARNGFIEVK